jgi:hypothetical protein
MTYDERKAAALWHELKYIYPGLAPPPKERDAEQDKCDLFGSDERKETADADKGTN